MKTNLKQLILDFKQPYLRALLLVALVPLLPEYIGFFFVVAALIVGAADFKCNPRKMKLGFTGWVLLAYCTYMTLTCIISKAPLQSLLISGMWWWFFSAFVLVKNLLTNEDRMDAFLICISFVAGAIGLIACIQYVFNLCLPPKVNVGGMWDWLDAIIFKFIPVHVQPTNITSDRVFGPFTNPNILAQYLVMLIPFVACFNFIQRRESLRIPARISLILSCAGVMFTFSRGSYLALIAIVLALIILNIRHRFSTMFLYAAAALLFIPKDVIYRFSDTSPSGREKIWAKAVEFFAESPIFGYGCGTDATGALFRAAGFTKAPHAHNLILQILLEGGIIALLIFSLFAFKAIKDGIHLMKGGFTESFWVGFTLIAFIGGFSIHGLVDYPLTTPRLICTFITLLAVIEQAYPLYHDRKIPVKERPKRTKKKKVS